MNKIKFLRIVINNHPLIRKDTEFSLSTVQPIRVNDEFGVSHLYGRRWVNNVSTVVGRNATGKTTLLTAIVGSLFLFWGNRSIDQTPLQDLLFGNDDIIFEVYFYGSDGWIYQDNIVFSKNSDREWYIFSEVIKSKRAHLTDTKDKIYDFEKANVLIDRDLLPENAKDVLAIDDSIFRMVMKRGEYETPVVYNSLIFTDNNTLIRDDGEIPMEILEYLDPSIEYLNVEETESGEIFRLKFRNTNDEIVEHKFKNLQHYLSSGTAKGITLFQLMLSVLKNGGYLFIDEIENHFNQAIVRTFINFFNDSKINANEATLVFSTHYSELLQDITRGDQIYVVDKKEKTEVRRYSSQKIRADLNRTDVFNANMIDGSSPNYSSYLSLKKATIRTVHHEQ